MMEWAWNETFVPQKSEHIDVSLGFAQLHAEKTHELPEWPSSSPKTPITSPCWGSYSQSLRACKALVETVLHHHHPPPSTSIIQFMRQTQVRIQSWSVTKSGRKLERLEDLESSQQLWGLEASGNIIQVRIRQGRAFPPTIATKQTEGPSIKTTPSQRDGKNKNILEKKYDAGCSYVQWSFFQHERTSSPSQHAWLRWCSKDAKWHRSREIERTNEQTINDIQIRQWQCSWTLIMLCVLDGKAIASSSPSRGFIQSFWSTMSCEK